MPLWEFRISAMNERMLCDQSGPGKHLCKRHSPSDAPTLEAKVWHSSLPLATADLTALETENIISSPPRSRELHQGPSTFWLEHPFRTFSSDIHTHTPTWIRLHCMQQRHRHVYAQTSTAARPQEAQLRHFQRRGICRGDTGCYPHQGVEA